MLEDTYGHTKGYDELLRSLAAQSTAATEKKRKPKEKKASTHSKGGKTSRHGTEEKAGKSRDAAEKKRRKSKQKEAEKAPTQRLHHRKKYIANKDVSTYSQAQLKEIFGV